MNSSATDNAAPQAGLRGKKRTYHRSTSCLGDRIQNYVSHFHIAFPPTRRVGIVVVSLFASLIAFFTVGAIIVLWLKCQDGGNKGNNELLNDSQNLTESTIRDPTQIWVVSDTSPLSEMDDEQFKIYLAVYEKSS